VIRILLLVLFLPIALLAGSLSAAGVPPAQTNPDYDQAPINWEGLQKDWLKDLPRAEPDEPELSTYSEQKAKDFLDDTAVKWARQNRCGTCHTTISYLMARPLLGGNPVAWDEVREAASNFAADRVATHARDAAFIAGSTAAGLAVGDALGGRTLQPDTRGLLAYLWASQGTDGTWVVPQRGMLPFLERDPRYLAYLVALGVGYAPQSYYAEPGVKAGLTRLRRFIHEHMPDNVHDKAMLLWASVRTPDLLTREQQANFVHSLLVLQKQDGGWTLPSLGTWPRHDGAPNDPRGDSDGYATSLAALVLCQSGYSLKDRPIRRAVTWIQRHQRVSGRWYTRSLYSDRFQNYLSNMATAYAVMALNSCQMTRS
jgi:squalene-hopene/tetraprenyl-beta-curcumene cyclase